MHSPHDILTQKKALRLEMQRRRQSLSPAQRDEASAALCQRLAGWLQTRPERTIGIYLSLPHEISLDSLINELIRRGTTLAAPRVEIETGQMRFWRLPSLEAVEMGPWQVRQPLATERITDIPLLFVPGLAFDPAGARLGTGGGWYDRTLEAAQTLVGVCFDCQIAPCVPMESHDRRVHYVGSESRWLEVGGAQNED